MTRAEIDVRVDLLVGRKAGATRYVSQRKRKPR